MKFIKQSIPDVVLLEPRVFGDARGFFMETWRADQFEAEGLPSTFVQDNFSRSTQGVLRGLHYQIQHPQGKLVRVTSGAVFDVAVDLRRHSKSFGHWVGAELSAANKRALWVPPGFAHGFYVLSDIAGFAYKCTDYYAAQFERSLRWDDPRVGIAWPLVKGQPPQLSVKDGAGELLQDAEIYD